MFAAWRNPRRSSCSVANCKNDIRNRQLNNGKMFYYGAGKSGRNMADWGGTGAGLALGHKGVDRCVDAPETAGFASPS